MLSTAKRHKALVGGSLRARTSSLKRRDRLAPKSEIWGEGGGGGWMDGWLMGGLGWIGDALYLKGQAGRQAGR